MKKLLVLTSNVNDYNPKRIREEAAKIGVETDLVQYHDLNFVLEERVKVMAAGEDLFDYGYLILRGTGAKNFDFYIQRDALAKFLWGDERVRVLNHSLFFNFPGQFDKLMQNIMLDKAGLPVIPSRVYGHFDQLERGEKELPFIMKGFVGSHGSQVKRITTERGKKYFMGVMLPWRVMCQPFFRSGEDYRVIVIGGKVLGAMKRTAGEGEYVTNVSAGGAHEAAEVTDELRDLALRSAEAFGAEYAGVDIMYDESGKAYVLEVNKAAEFKGFEACTGLNVAGEMVKFLLNEREENP